MAKAKKSTSGGQSFSGNVLKNQKAIQKLEQEIKYDEEIVENIQKKPVLSKDDLNLIENFNKKIEKAREKLEGLKEVNDKLKEGTDEYESTLRSIGSRYGEINDIYKESEKILSSTKNEISSIVSITGLLSTSNKAIINSVLKSQKAYRGIATSIVENIGSLEDSEGAYKKIGIQIDEQKQLVQDIGKELESIDKSDEKQVKAAEKLKKQLTEQANSLDKMKKAGQDVKRTFDGINMLGNELSNTMFGGWVDKFLSITKVAGVTSFGSISEMLDKFKEPIAEKTINKLSNADAISQQPQTQVPAPTQPEAVQQTAASTQTQVPPPTQPAPQQNISTELPSTIHVSTEKLEEEQTKYAEKSAESMSSFSAASLRDERRKNRASRVSFGKYASKQKSTKVESPSIEKVANEIKENNSIQIQNSEKTNEVISNSQTNTSDSLDQVKTEFKQAEIERANASEKEKIESRQTDISGQLQSDKAAVASRALGGGRFIAKAGLAAALIGLGKEIMTFGDSMNAVITRYIAEVTGGTETMKRFAESVVSGKGEYSDSFKKSIEDTEDYRKLQFQYTIKANVKERQNLETDYFNYQKQVFFDYYEYENEVVRQNVDYELGLRRDALQFQFQQQSANLDAELEKRKTLAGSAMKFIGNYSKISERALNAIGSSTKAIMDGMKQFGAILGGTNKSQFELVENAQGLAYAYGGSADQVLNMSHMFKLLGNTTEKVGMGLTEGLKGFVTNQGGNIQSVFNEIVEASADIYRLMSATPDQIAKQTVALQKAGTKLSTMLKASDTMVLNYKDSIKAEMSLGAMIGRSVNFTEARAALMSGDMVGAANAIRQSLGGIDVNQLNPFAKQELARATGLSMDQIIQIQQGGKIQTDEDKQLQIAERTGKTIANAVLNQDIANAGARLALEQSQRKQMLEMEQAQRLVMLRLEQKQKLEQIPVESAYRFYWDKIYAFKFAKEDMTIDALGEVLTSMLQKGNDFTGGAEQYLKQLEKQQLGPDANVMQNLQTLGINYQTTAAGQISIPSLQTGVGATANLTPQIKSLGNTIVALDNKVNDMNISSKDIRYQQWLLGSHDISQKYKGGKTPELAEKEYKDLFNKLFSAEIQLEQKQQTNVALESIKMLESKIDINKIQDRDDYFEIIRKFSDNQKIDKGFFGGNYAKIDGKEFNLSVLKGSKEDIELRNVIQKKLDQQRQLQINQVDILKQQLQQGKITQDTFNSKINELKNSMNINLNIQQPTTLPNKFVDNSEELKKAAELNPSYFKDGKPIAGTIADISKKYNPFPFTPNTTNTTGVLNSFSSPVGGQLGGPVSTTTTSTTNTQIQTNVPTPTTPPQQEGISSPNQITVDMESTNSILNRIQSEADQRGITMYTKQIDQNGNLQRIVTRTQNTAAAVETTKPDIKKVADIGVASTQNLEQIQIEMIKELQTANELLVGVLNNTAPADKGMIINLDGSKIAQNFIGRMNNRRSFNGSNTVPTRV